MSPDDALVAAVDRALADVPGIVSVYLFGSAAAGRAHSESDIDLGVWLDWHRWPSRRDRFELRVALLGTFGRRLGRTVDLLVLNDVPPQLARRIMTEGRRLIVRDRAADHAQLCVTLSRAADIEPFLRRTRAIKLQSLAS